MTGEAERTTDFEHGMPIRQALTDGAWIPDPLIIDDQALIVHVAGHGLRRIDPIGVVTLCDFRD